MTGNLRLVIGSRHSAPVADYESASALYADIRDASGEGGSTFPDGKIMDGEREAARVSYNAKVWAPEPWQSGAVPLFNPYADRGEG